MAHQYMPQIIHNPNKTLPPPPPPPSTYLMYDPLLVFFKSFLERNYLFPFEHLIHL